MTSQTSCSAGAAELQLVFNTPIQDSLTSQTCLAIYEFQVSSPARVQLKLRSPGIQTFLQLVDSAGVIRMNSALDSVPDTTTTERLVVGPGTWGVSVVGYHVGTPGAYTLTATTDSAPVVGCAPVWITGGAATTQTVTHADCTQGPGGANFYYHVYEMILKVGQGVDAKEYSTAMAPQVVLVGGDGTEPSTADSLGTTSELATTIQSQGSYRLWVGSSVAGQVGTYTLTFN